MISIENKLLRLSEKAGVSITKELLFDLYVNKQYSLPMLKKELKLQYRTSVWLLDYFNIPRRDFVQASVAGIARTKKSIIEKYGVDNISKSNDIKEKKKETCLLNHGVDNIWKHSDYNTWITKTMMDKYGKKRCNASFEVMSNTQKKCWAKLSQEEKYVRMKPLMDNCAKCINSKPELYINKILLDNNFSFMRNPWIKPYRPDFVINGEVKIIIEVFGDFWHANPAIYKESDILSFRGGYRPTAKELWEKDQKRLDFFKHMGYSVIVIWEMDLKTFDVIKEIEKIHASQIDQKNITQLKAI